MVIRTYGPLCAPHTCVCCVAAGDRECGGRPRNRCCRDAGVNSSSARSTKWECAALPHPRKGAPFRQTDPTRRQENFQAVAPRGAQRSPKRERKNLRARPEKLDFELAIGDGLRLSDQLVQTLLGDRAVALFININTVSRAWRLSSDQHA